MRILPDIVQLIANGGKDVLSRVRDVRVEDVLGREQIELADLTNTLVSGKVVMVTGGGGTVAQYVANRDIDVVDIGVPVLSMHSPFELVSKLDVYCLLYTSRCV